MCVTQATDAGYFALNSQGWYFDNLDATWEQMYVNDPTQGVESAASQARVLGGQGEMWCAKRHFLSTFYIKTIILPRQARDKHRESTQKRTTVFPQGGDCRCV